MPEQWLRIPKPNPGLEQEIRTSQRLKLELFARAVMLRGLYSATARKGKTRRLSGMVEADVEPSTWGPKAGRPIGTVRATAPHAVWRLTGAGPGMHTHSTGREPRGGPYRGDFTFTHIVKMMR